MRPLKTNYKRMKANHDFCIKSSFSKRENVQILIYIQDFLFENIKRKNIGVLGY